jgi:hypothetical protein
MRPASEEAFERTSTVPGSTRAPPRPWLAITIVICGFIPLDYGFRLFDVRLGFARILLIALAPYIVFSYWRMTSSSQYRFLPSDFFFFVTGTWLVAAPTIVEGWPRGTVHGGMAAVEFTIAYVVTRTLPRNADEIYSIARVICICSAVCGALAIADTLSGQWVFRTIAGISDHLYSNSEDLWRFGLRRATGTFEHPIMLGSAMVFALVLARSLEWKSRTFTRIGCFVGLCVALSSAPFLAAAIALGLLFYGRISSSPHRWFVLGILGAIPLSLFIFIHPNPFGFIFSHLLLNPQTGYYRLLIWQYAGAEVLHFPVLGVGFSEPSGWARPEWLTQSVDSLWLNLALNFGIPGSILTALCFISTSWSPVRRSEANYTVIDAREQQLAESIGIVFFLMIFLGFTVHIWGICWLQLAFLAGLRANLGQLSASVVEAPPSIAPESDRDGADASMVH